MNKLLRLIKQNYLVLFAFLLCTNFTGVSLGAILFEEGFNDGVANGITFRHPSMMSIGPGPFGTGNALFAADSASTTNRDAVFSLDGIPSDNVRIELDFSIANRSYGDLDIWLNAALTSTEINASHPYSGYAACVNPAGSDNPVALLFRDDSSVRSVLDSSPNTISANTPHSLRIERFGSSIKTYLDDVQILSANDGTYFGESIAFRFHGGGAVDNIRVTTVPEPSIFVLLAMGALGLLVVRRKRG